VYTYVHVCVCAAQRYLWGFDVCVRVMLCKKINVRRRTHRDDDYYCTRRLLDVIDTRISIHYYNIMFVYMLLLLLLLSLCIIELRAIYVL
jgi:hypothetical protein